MKAIRMVTEKYEQDPAICTLMDNLLSYFSWCRNCRNQLLHAALYPSFLGGVPDFLHLTKRVGKQSPKSGYMKLSLERVRHIAESIQKGVIQSAEIHLYLRYAGKPIEQIPQTYRQFAKPPSELKIPKHLELTEKP